MTAVTDAHWPQAQDDAIKTMVSDMNSFLAAFQFLAHVLWGEPREVVRVRRVPASELR